MMTEFVKVLKCEAFHYLKYIMQMNEKIKEHVDQRMEAR